MSVLCKSVIFTSFVSSQFCIVSLINFSSGNTCFISDLVVGDSEQPSGGQEHASTESTACLRLTASPGRHAHRQSRNRCGKLERKVVSQRRDLLS